MPVYFFKALFTAVGLGLILLSYDLVRRVKSWPGKACLHAMAGLAALFTANALGDLLGMGVGLNGLTLPVSAALGVPGVGLLWAVKYLL